MGSIGNFASRKDSYARKCKRETARLWRYEQRAARSLSPEWALRIELQRDYIAWLQERAAFWGAL